MKRFLALAVGLCLPVSGQTLTPKALIESERPQACSLSPDGHWLLVQSARVDWKRNRSVSQLKLYGWGQDAPLLTLPEASGGQWSPDGSKFLFQSSKSLSVCSTRTWRQKVVYTGECGGICWAPDSQQVVISGPVGRRPGGDSGRIYDDLFFRRWNHYWDGRRQHLFLLDGQGGPPQDLTPDFADAAPTSGTYSSGSNVCFSKDGRALFFSAPPARGQAYDTNYDLYRLDLATRKMENLTSDNPAADFGPQLDPASGRLFIVSHRRPGYESDWGQRSLAVDDSGHPQGAWRREDLGPWLGEWHCTPRGLAGVRQGKGVQQAFWGERSLPHQGSLHSLTTGGERWAGIEDGLDRAPQVLWGGLLEGELRRIGVRPNWTLGSVESLQVPVEGASMSMWLVKPPGYRPDQRWPVVMLIHGGPQGAWGDSWSQRWNAQCWAALGYLVALPNPRGSSGGDPLFQEQVSRDWGGLAYRDLMAAADALAARKDVDPSRMMCAGASYGGYMVNWIAVHTGRFRALVTHCGIWNLESMYGATDELWFADWELGGPPWQDPKPPDYERFSPHHLAAQLGQYRTPHLVIHNDLDFRCPLDQGLQLFTALQRQGVESRLLNFPDEGHWVVRPANSLRWYLEVFTFVTHHCPPGGHS